VRIIEVGPRDGLQNEAKILSVAQREELVTQLLGAGSTIIECGAFVSEKWVPQMKDSDVLAKILKEKFLSANSPSPKAKSSAVQSNAYALKARNPTSFAKALPRLIYLVPNQHGFQTAIDSGVSEVAVFTAASESFSKKNINCTIEESLTRYAAVCKEAKKRKIKVRGYVSTAFYCPFEGAIDSKKVLEVSKALIQMGCYEVSIGDTIGAAGPGETEALIKKLKAKIKVSQIAMHFHDTRGMAVANALASYKIGIRTFDSSIAGLGGCPYAPGASGNVATEDLVFMFESMGIKTGLELKKLKDTHAWVSTVLEKRLPSKVGNVADFKK
jgi:hydroxymethylglutaryl-CoA lyase